MGRCSSCIFFYANNNFDGSGNCQVRSRLVSLNNSCENYRVSRTQDLHIGGGSQNFGSSSYLDSPIYRN